MPPFAARTAALWLLCATPSAAVPAVILFADFDDEPVDQPIGTGGAAAGQPTQVSPGIAAVVRSGPFPTPCLALADSSTGAGSARFEFFDATEVTDGTVTITASLRFRQLENFFVYVREAGSLATSHLNLTFYDDGSVWHRDIAGNSISAGTYATGPALDLLIRFDIAPDGTGSYSGDFDIVLDGVPHATDHAFTAPRGIGSVLFGILNDTDLDGSFAVDDVVVTVESSTTSVDPSPWGPSSWGGIKASFRDASPR